MGGFSTSPDIAGLAVEATLDAVALLLADAEQDTDLLLSRLTAAGALGSDLATANAGIVTTNGRLSAGRAGYLDNLSAGAVALAVDLATVLSRLSAVRAGYLDNLSAGPHALASDMATVLSRLSALRAGYLDNLSAGAVATAAALTTAQGNITTLLSRAGANVALATDLATAQGNLTTLLSRAGANVALATDLATAQGNLSTLLGRIPGTLLQSIKLIQRGTVAFAASEASATMTITAVDLTKSMLFSLGFDSTHTTSFFRIALTNSTTVTATRALTSATLANIGFQIVEFN